MYNFVITNDKEEKIPFESREVIDSSNVLKDLIKEDVIYLGIPEEFQGRNEDYIKTVQNYVDFIEEKDYLINLDLLLFLDFINNQKCIEQLVKIINVKRNQDLINQMKSNPYYEFNLYSLFVNLPEQWKCWCHSNLDETDRNPYFKTLMLQWYQHHRVSTNNYTLYPYNNYLEDQYKNDLLYLLYKTVHSIKNYYQPDDRLEISNVFYYEFYDHNNKIKSIIHNDEMKTSDFSIWIYKDDVLKSVYYYENDTLVSEDIYYNGNFLKHTLKNELQ